MRGSRSGQLVPEAGYATALYHGQVIFKANDGDSVEQWGINAVAGEDAGADENPPVFPKSPNVVSSVVAEKNARTVVNGTPAFETEREVNVVLDRQFNVAAAANFGTWVTVKAWSQSSCSGSARPFSKVFCNRYRGLRGGLEGTPR